MKKKKGIKAERMKTAIPTRASIELIENDEQNGKLKKEKMKEGAGPQPSSLVRTCMDHTVDLF